MSSLSHDEIVLLDPQERLTLIGDLWDSMGDADVALRGTQRLELERRLERFDEDRGNVVSWLQLKAELAARKS